MEDGDRPAQNIYEMCARLDTGTLGLRDRHKVEKLKRISAATRELFSERGYEGTTLRQIASQADVALGTLSLYAEDKRDLIVMLFNQMIPPLMDRAASKISKEATLVENLVEFFSVFYQDYANDVTLYRLILGQLFNRPTSIHALEHDRIRVHLIATLSEVISIARERGEIEVSGDLEHQAHSIFYMYFATVRLWLANESPVPEDGIADLKAMIEQLIAGMGRQASS